MVAAATEVKVINRSTWFIDIEHAGEEYRINCWLTWCEVRKTRLGDWWQIATRTGLTSDQQRAIAMDLATGGVWHDMEYKWRFDLPAVC